MFVVNYGTIASSQISIPHLGLHAFGYIIDHTIGVAFDYANCYAIGNIIANGIGFAIGYAIG